MKNPENLDVNKLIEVPLISTSNFKNHIMAKEYQQFFFSNRQKWREWLEKHHDNSEGIFIVYYKKHTGKASIPYNDAVEEALCFGWIDSIVRRIDDERYMQKFTPRNIKSLWSDSNKERVKKMIESGKMTEAGLSKIKKAKQNGKWNEAPNAKKDFVLSNELLEMFSAEPIAKKAFDKLAPSHRKNYVQWIMSAKKPETQKRRFMQMIEILKDPKKKMPNI
jgi:uncharacterized protein YdeI (YjbR/CyaY-like superfamily)